MLKHCIYTYILQKWCAEGCRRLYSSKPDINAKSSLYLSGNTVKDASIVVTAHLDFDEKFHNITNLQENVKRRGLNVNVTELRETWDFYKHWDSSRVKLEQNREEVTNRLKEVLKLEDGENKTTEIKRLKIMGKMLKDDLKDVKKNIFDIKDIVMTKLLNLPNDLHPDTPEKEEVLQNSGSKSSCDVGLCHLKSGMNLNCIDYRNQMTCFLRDEASLFELAVAEFVVEKLSDRDYVQFCNSDFARSVLIEGVGLPPLSADKVFLLHNIEGQIERLYLCGGASLFPFCGFHAKNYVNTNKLPLRYVTHGRQYNPKPLNLPGLYSVMQSTAVQVFIATNDRDTMNSEFLNLTLLLSEIYKSFDLDFKIVKQPARDLQLWECLRASIQVFSPHFQVYVEVGHLSIIDDFISKRLRMCYKDKNEERFLKVVSGTIVNVHTLLAICLEQSQNELFIPKVLKTHMLT